MRRAALAVLLGAAVALSLNCGPAQPPEEGARIYAELGCARCHGDQLEGKRTAPPLLGLAEHWNAAELTRFIQDPAGYEPVPSHIRQMREETPLRMPPLAHEVAPEQVATLVDYLLKQQAPTS